MEQQRQVQALVDKIKEFRSGQKVDEKEEKEAKEAADVFADQYAPGKSELEDSENI